MAELLKSTSVDVFISNGLFIDIGIPDDYLIAQTKLAHLA
jgi:predicted RNA-binding protein (virulence factor B family)